MADKLPGARAALVDDAGVTTPQFYRYFQALERLQAGTASAADITAINVEIAALQAQISALPESSFPTLQVAAPLTSAGLLQNGFAKLGLTFANSIVVNGIALQLDGDALAPGNTYLYSTGPTGTKGWNALGGMLAGTAGNIAKTVNADGTVTFDLSPVTDSGTGTFKLITRDSFGRLSGTKSGTTSDVPEGTNLYFTDARVDARLSPGYIDGLQMQWVSATAVTVSSGTAYIPSLGAYLQSNAAIALSGLTLTASTWYHLYLYSNAGTPAVECVTTAPVLYQGGASQKTGDNSRRYVGSIRTDASGNIIRFNHMLSGNDIRYMQSINNAPQHPLVNGAATVPTNIDLSGSCPATSRRVWLYLENSDTSGNVIFIGNSDGGDPGTVSGLFSFMRSNEKLSSNYLLSSVQDINYEFNAAPVAGTGLTVWVLGYNYDR